WKDCVAAMVGEDGPGVASLLRAAPDLARARAESGGTRANAGDHYLAEIEHYLYGGDTALHIVAAAHRAPMIRQLLAAGAEVAARNRRGAQPLHYAADGVPGSRTWNR